MTENNVSTYIDDEMDELELSTEQIERQDEIENAVHNLIKVFTEDYGIPWNQEYIGDLADTVAGYLIHKGFKIRYPAIVEDYDGREYIEDYFE